MEKKLKIFMWIVVVGLFIGIFIAMNSPRPSMTIYDEAKLNQIVRNLNSDLPRKIGTIGIMDSIVYHDRTITYNITVFGDNGIKEIYKKNYEKFKDMLKYSLLSMNGQRNMGNKLSSIMDMKELNLGFKIYTQDGEATEWKMPGSELNEFMKACKMSPTTALGTTLDMQIEIANLHLPVNIEDVRNPIRSVALNTIFGELDENCLPKAISHVKEDVVFEYDVAEGFIDIDAIENNKDNLDVLESIASSLIEDEDVYEFFGIIAISHSNIVITYEERNTHKKVSIRIPYNILKKHSKVPQYLLS